MVCTLSNTYLIAIGYEIKVTITKVLAVCHTQIAIADNMSLMGLSIKGISAVQKMMKK